MGSSSKRNVSAASARHSARAHLCLFVATASARRAASHQRARLSARKPTEQRGDDGHCLRVGDAARKRVDRALRVRVADEAQLARKHGRRLELLRFLVLSATTIGGRPTNPTQPQTETDSLVQPRRSLSSSTAPPPS